MVDLEEQDDELTAIECIYPKTFFRDNDVRGGRIEISVVLSEKIKVICKTSDTSSRPTSSDKQNSIKQVTGFDEAEISYLPPVVLHFDYPKDYPSVSPPNYTLSCRWLDVEKLMKLCNELDSLWNEQGCGNVILFQWIQYLADNTLFITDVTTPFHVRVSHDTKYNTKRCYQDSTSSRSLFNYLIDYDQHENETVFNSELFPCGVCFMDVRGSDCVAFQNCKHIYCKPCMAEYFKVQILDGAVTRLTCPYNECSTQANPNQVQKLVSAELYTKYEKFLLHSGLDSMADIVYCPRKDCQEPVIVEDINSPCICASCRYAFCLTCKRSYHGVSPCSLTASEFLKIRKEYNEGTEEDRELLERKYGKKKLKRMFEESVSEEWINRNSKQCPKCRSNIEKSDGCNKMTCSHCSRSFCWICLQLLPSANPYNHFNNVNSKCFNKLFEGIESDEDDFDDDWIDEEF